MKEKYKNLENKVNAILDEKKFVAETEI